MGHFRSAFLHTCCTIHVWSNTAKYTRAYGAFDAELCTTDWTSVLTNRQNWENIFTYIWYISCVNQMQQTLQVIWCFVAMIFFATYFNFFNLIVL